MRQSSKRFLSMLLALAFVVVAFIVFFDLIQPTYDDLQTLKGKQLSSEDFLANEKAIVNQVKKMVAQYQNEGDAVTSLALAMPSGPNIAGALAQVYGIATNNNIMVTNIGFSAPSVAFAGGSETGSQILKPPGMFSLQITASGSYENFKNFLTQLETNIRVFDITSLSLQPVTSAQGGKGATFTPNLFTYNITVVTYYQLP